MSKEQPKILIVEDELDQIEPMQAYFTRNGYAVLQTQNGHKALSIIKESKPDIVLLDLTLEQPLGGKAILEKLRKYDKDTKVIVMTGNLRIEDKEVESIRSLGISKFLYKPIVLSNLENLIKKLLGIEYIPLSPYKAQQTKISHQDLSVSTLIHDISNSLGVIRNKCENFTLDIEDNIHKDKSDKELVKIAVEIMKLVITTVDRATQAVEKISSIVKKNK